MSNMRQIPIRTSSNQMFAVILISIFHTRGIALR
jgi:hypothetical protein